MIKLNWPEVELVWKQRRGVAVPFFRWSEHKRVRVSEVAAHEDHDRDGVRLRVDLGRIGLRLPIAAAGGEISCRVDSIG